MNQEDMRQQEQFNSAVEMNDIEAVKILLKDKEVDPAYLDNICMLHVAEYGFIEMTELLLSDPRIDPSDTKSYALHYATEYGHFDIIKLLLNDPRVIPEVNNNDAIITAYKNVNKFSSSQYLFNDIIQYLWAYDSVKKSLKNDNNSLYNELRKLDIKSKIKEF